MATVYSIQHTDTNVPSFIINPSQIDGLGGPNSNSSLILHGTGRLKYGEALNENLLHLLENFASPAIALPIIISIQSANNNGAVGTHFIKIFDDKTDIFISGYTFQVIGSTGTVNDNNYTVSSSTYDQPSNLTTIIFQESFVDDQAAFLGNVSYNIIEPNPLMVIPPYNIGQLWFNKSDNNLYVYKDISGTGIKQWSQLEGINIGVAPLFPATGQLWYDQSVPQLKIYDGTNWISVADNYVLKSGDTIKPNTNILGSVGNTNGVLQFANSAGNNTLIFNEGLGAASNGPDIRATASMLQVADDSFRINIDSNNDSIGKFVVAKGTYDINSDNLLIVQNDGKIIADTPAYETLVTFDNVIPNKKYVDDSVAGLGSSLNFVTPTSLTTTLASYVLNSDLTTSLANYVLKSGDTMNGALRINTTGITIGLGNPANPAAGHFGFVVDAISGANSGGVLIRTGDTTDAEHGIELVNHLGQRKYSLKSKSGDLFLYGNVQHLVGSRLFLDQNPTGNLEAATKSYVDTSLTAVPGVPISTVITVPNNSIPTGYFKCNGAAISRTTYSALFAAIGTSYGVGNGTTTFNLPDLRGEFIRGWDNARGIDSGRVIGSFQADDFKSHNHLVASYAGTQPGIRVSAATIGSSQGGNQSSFTGGTETRPRNVAMLYVIKY